MRKYSSDEVKVLLRKQRELCAEYARIVKFPLVKSIDGIEKFTYEIDDNSILNAKLHVC